MRSIRVHVFGYDFTDHEPGHVCIDWDDSETSLAHLTNDKGGATGLSISGERGGVSGGDHLWEDNWDDDDVEDDFSKALR